MLSKALFKKTTKENYKLWVILTGVLMFMLIIMTTMANVQADGMAGGFGGAGNAPGDSILGSYYSMFATMLLTIYVVITANKLIASQVDKGSFSYVMANPVKRNQVSLTQAVYLIGSVAVTFLLLIVTGLVMIAATGIEASIGAFLLLNLGAFLLVLAISGISFLASCIFNRSGLSFALGGGIPIAFFLLNMLASFEEQVSFMGTFKYFTLNTLFNTKDIIAFSTNMIWQFIILAVVAVGCYIGGMVYFKRKDLPL